MQRKWTKRDILTLPNAMSLFRLCLIPVILWLYCVRENTVAAVCVIALSGATDIAAGKIARKYNMVSDFGKILDPVADKLTQGSVILCIASRYPPVSAMIAVFCVKEALMVLMGGFAMRYAKCVNSAKWYGKACTVLLDASMAVMVLLPNLPETAVIGMVVLCCLAMCVSLALYARFYMNLLKNTAPWTEHKPRWKTAYRIVIVCLWAAVLIVLLFHRDRFSVDEVLRYTPKNPVLAAVMMLLLFALKSVSIVIHCGILYAANGILFPIPAAVVLNILGTAVMVSVPYFIGRHSGGELSEKILSRFPKATRIKDFRDRNDFMFTLIVRMVGFVPCDVVSLYFGACRTNYPKYLLACILGMLPPIITMPIIGTNVSNVGSPPFILSVCANLTCMALSLIVGAALRAKQKNKQTKEQNHDQSPSAD